MGLILATVGSVSGLLKDQLRKIPGKWASDTRPDKTDAGADTGEVRHA